MPVTQSSGCDGLEPVLENGCSFDRTSKNIWKCWRAYLTANSFILSFIYLPMVDWWHTIISEQTRLERHEMKSRKNKIPETPKSRKKIAGWATSSVINPSFSLRILPFLFVKIFYANEQNRLTLLLHIAFLARIFPHVCGEGRMKIVLLFIEINRIGFIYHYSSCFSHSVFSTNTKKSIKMR